MTNLILTFSRVKAKIPASPFLYSSKVESSVTCKEMRANAPQGSACGHLLPPSLSKRASNLSGAECGVLSSMLRQLKALLRKRSPRVSGLPSGRLIYLKMKHHRSPMPSNPKLTRHLRLPPIRSGSVQGRCQQQYKSHKLSKAKRSWLQNPLSQGHPPHGLTKKGLEQEASVGTR